MTGFGGATFGYAAVPGGRIHYAEAGSGTPLLCLHATPRSHRSFRNLLPLFAAKHRAIAVDAPGFGNSSDLPAGVTLEAMADRLVAFLDARGIDCASIFGLHTGNKLAVAMADRHPGRIAALVLAGHTHSLIADPAERDKAIHALSDHYPPPYAEVPGGGHHIRDWVSAHAEAQKLWWQQNLVSSANIEKKDIEYAEARVTDYLLGRRSIRPVYEAIFKYDFNAALARIDMPALVLELLAPDEAHFGEQAPKVCAMMKRASPARIPGGDRSWLEKHPAEVAAPVLAFLASVA